MNIHEHLKKYKNQVWKRLNSDGPMDLAHWQERILFAVFAATLLFGLFPLYLSLKMAIATSLWLNFSLYLGIYLVIAVVAFSRGIPLLVGSWLAIGLLFLLGALAFFTLGPHGSGRIYIYASAVLASLLLSLRSSIGFLAFVIAFCAVFTYLLNSGKVGWRLVGVDPIATWNTTLFTFIFLCVLTCMALAVLIKGLASALRRSRDYARQLAETGEALRQEMEQQRQLQAVVGEREKKFKDLFESAPNAYLSLDKEGRIRRCNRQAVILLDRPAENLVGCSIMDFLADNSHGRDRALRALDRFRRGQEATEEELQMLKPDGRPVWVRMTVNAMRDAQGELSEGRVILTDVSKLVLAEEALSESEHRFRQLFDESPAPLFLQDFSLAKERMLELAASGVSDLREYLKHNPAELLNLLSKVKLSFLNRATLALYEAENLEDMVTSLAGLASSEPSEHFLDQLLCLYEGNGRFEGSGKNLTQKGNEIDILVKKVVVAGAEGDLSRVLTSIVDLSAIKRAQLERGELESQLRQAQKMEAVGTLAGGIAHDFNNILTAIMGYAEIALEQNGSRPENAEELKGILSAAERARGLVRQILTFSRRTDSELSLIDINKEVVTTANLLKQALPKMIDIKLTLAKNVLAVMGDPYQIEQIVLNLGTNSRDAMPEGGAITIATSLQTVESVKCLATGRNFSGRFVVIEVGDNGHGMSQSVLERIFDPFFTTKAVGKGTGLGLAAVFGIVGAHNGHISCQSEPGKGAIFKIYLPPAQGEPAPAADKDTTETLAGRGETVLLVDDEAQLLEIAALNLSRGGYQVLTAMSGEDALALFQDKGQDIDLVILDLSMPGMGGYKCLQGLLTARGDLKVIVATGYSRDGDLGAAMASGAAALLSKPFTRRELLKTVRQVLET